jgi:hypothetical protein
MSRDDELRVPAFSRVVQGGSSRVAPFRVSLSRRLALAFAMLCVVVITLAIVTLRDQAPVDLISETAVILLPSLPDTSDFVVVPPVVNNAEHPRANVAVKRVRPRETVNDLTLAMRLSTWRSPTSSLLTTTSDDKLMSLPKLGESLQTLRFYSLDDLN